MDGDDRVRFLIGERLYLRPRQMRVFVGGEAEAVTDGARRPQR